MNVSLINPAAPTAEASRPAATTTSVQAARWRLALEQAQWQQAGDRSSLPRASRAEAPPPAPPSRAAAWSAVPVGPAADALSIQVRTVATAMDGAASAAAVGPVTTTAPEKTAALPSSVDLGIEALAAPPPPTAPASAATAGSAPETEAPAARAPAFPEHVVPTPWPPFNAQAHVDGRAVSAAVRDPSLDANDADDLERRLASQLAADGLDLVELRVNGRLAGRADRPAAQN